VCVNVSQVVQHAHRRRAKMFEVDPEFHPKKDSYIYVRVATSPISYPQVPVSRIERKLFQPCCNFEGEFTARYELNF
jgi:hypothetical protein